MARMLAKYATLLAASVSMNINLTAPPLGFPQALQQSWAGYSPWFPAAIYVPPPAGCEVVQVRSYVDLSVGRRLIERFVR